MPEQPRVSIEAIRRQRRRDVPVGRYTFVIEVPTDMKFFRLLEEHPKDNDFLLNGELAKACVVGWKGVKESDLLSSGTDDEVPFERAAFLEWIEDHSEWWNDLAGAVVEARKQLKEQREADAKN
jgi:hypothetical protein